MAQEEESPYIYLEVFGEQAGNVDVSPEIIVAPQDTTMVQGSQSSLQCIANAKPLEQLEIIWLKDGVNIEHAGVFYT